ncbi:MAG TPA: Vms1/Ankzf1 family peptidyl-tRNA hydrolase [Gaiellaceae bacterium]|nr:Vms1/Ankzf1 family peptidyl-tRNA hydrolase [Gaiellaceae bacterium]
MAATVGWDTLRELAGYRAERGWALSLYLGLDPSTAPTAADVDARLSSLLAEGERRLEARRDALPREAREAAKADLGRIRAWFEHEFDRSGVQGVAVFAAGLDGLFRALPLAEPVEDEIRLGLELLLAPLVPLVGKGDGPLVAVVNRERGDVYRLRDGAFEQVADHTDELPMTRSDQGGWSQARYQRYFDELAEKHMKAVAGELDRRVRERTGPVVVVGPEEIRAEFSELLAQETRQAVVGWAVAEAHSTPAQVLEAIRPLLREAESAEEAALLERWRGLAGRGERATAGWDATLDAASDGRVEVLLYANGGGRPANRAAWQCPVCGRGAAGPGACPLDGVPMDERENGLDVAVHRTLAHGGTVRPVRHHADLGPAEGIGALLRF